MIHLSLMCGISTTKIQLLGFGGFSWQPTNKTHLDTHTHTPVCLKDSSVTKNTTESVFCYPRIFWNSHFFCWNPLGSCLFSNKNPIRWFLRSIAHKPSKPSALLKIHGHPSRIHQPVRRGCFFVNKNHAVSTVRNVEEHVGGLKIPMVIQRAWCI